MRRKIKTVWLCHFTNEEVQNKIKPFKRIGEFAPWIPSSIKLFENRDDIELHVISPHEYITGIKGYKKNGVHYYFYNAHMPLTGRHWPGFFKWDTISIFWNNKRITRKLVKKIKPEIIHLHGAENAYFSSTILQFFDKYPIIFTLQGFISNASANFSKTFLKRVAVEKEILNKIKYAFYRTETMKIQMLSFNPNLKFFWNDYPSVLIRPLDDIAKVLDIVFFARVSKDKGIEDLLRAVAIIKRNKPNISLCVIGGGNTETFERLAQELNISNSVTWAGFLPTQKDVHKMASQARICVLPTYHDMISGTIVESLFLKLPVVAYNVGSIHEVNEKEEIISLVDKLDVEGLAKAIVRLLDNPEVLKERAEKGYKRAQEMFVHSDEEIRKSLMDAYKEVIKEFKP